MKCYFLLLLAVPAIGLQASRTAPAQQYVGALKRVTDIMVEDVTSPVAAARYYAYTTLAAYEVMAGSRPDAYPSLCGALTHNLELDIPGEPVKDLASCTVLALWKAASVLLPSGRKLQSSIDSLAAQLPPQNVRLVDDVVRQVVAWAMTDGFLQLNNLMRYTPRRGPAYWQPTPPAYMAPIEPHWNTIRPMVLDSATQFVPLPPVAYDMTPDSPFYNLVKEVYDVVKGTDQEKSEIAYFWDCNPYAISQIGHVEFGMKKISPGGHWIGITGIACIKQKLPLEKTVLVHALVAVALHDAFLVCWDEKYRSNRVRPETVIQSHLDRSWRPLLQTPPFPEYVSGHSVASTASSVVLTRIFGKDFAFTDDSEVEFGLPVRKFSSFVQAADEASISRLYGGIHFRDAIDQAIWQGREVGQLVCSRLQPFFDLMEKKGRNERLR